MTVSRSVVKSEYHNTYVNRNFEVVDKLPELNVAESDDGNYVKMYTDVIEYSGSDFCGEDRSYDEGYYRYYRLTYSYWYDENGEKEDQSDDNYEYVAVWENFEPEE